MNENSENLAELPPTQQEFVNESEQFPQETEPKPQETLPKDAEFSSIMANGNLIKKKPL